MNLTCETCHQPITDKAPGYVTINHDDANKAEHAVAEWEKQNPGPAITGDALLDYPDPAHWQSLHEACDPEPDSSSYTITSHRIDDWPKLVAWTAHLMGKTWLEHTDWDELLATTAALGGIDTSKTAELDL